MSASLNINCLQETKLDLHLLPAEIQYDGQANVESYFKSTIRDDASQKKTASIRGRPLHGKQFEVPSGYTGLIVTEARKPFTEDEERELTCTQSFKSFEYWNLDREPSEEDKLQQAVTWIDVAKALHAPVDVGDSQGSLKSEPSI